MAGMRERITPPVAVAIALPLLLAIVVAGLGIYARATSGPDTGPLALPARATPQAGDARCAAVLAALPAELPGDTGPLPARELDPATPGARAWAAEPDPVVLRCGTTAPAELGPTSPLIVVNGVNWLQLPAPPGATTATYAAVDRAVHLELSAPPGTGSAPLQAVSDAITAALPDQLPVIRR